MTSSRPSLERGARVRLRSVSHVLTLSADTGTIVRPDEDLDYYVVRLDEPARYRHADGRTEWLDEIVEDIDNMETLDQEAPSPASQPGSAVGSPWGTPHSP